jgi:NADPH-dependent 2,4-dienoyl-CoA reductase/sulfur reductase-like enzyme
VIVVGAGPIGMGAALDLALHGVDTLRHGRGARPRPARGRYAGARRQ